MGGFSKVRSLQDLEAGEKAAGKFQGNNAIAAREQEILEQLKYQRVIHALSHDISRLTIKYKNANKKVAARENLLNVTMLALQKSHEDRTITVISLDKQLENLIKVLPSNTDTVKVLKKLRDNCKKAVKTEAALAAVEQKTHPIRSKRM